MNISFDLDSTLIPNGEEFEVENRGLLTKLLRLEPVRKGTAGLITYLKSEGHTVHVYTTSFRSPLRVRLTLGVHGIHIKRVVNQTENQSVLRRLGIDASKYPCVFNFDVHIDDSETVAQESEEYDFKTIIIQPSDKNWTETIKKELQRIVNNGHEKDH